MHDQVEILIGRLLDGEISPKERVLLENELERDSCARELYEQMRVLHECSCGVVTHEILEHGTDPADLFERAWQQNKRSFWRRVARGGWNRDGARQLTRADGHRRFAVGIAAGLLLGLVLNLLPLPQTQIPRNAPSWPPVARVVPSGRNEAMGTLPVSQTQGPDQVTREVDLYIVTDRAGNQWLIEGAHEKMVKPANYRGDLW
ncbi:MAG: hypothetical protein FJ280_25145 [Planctomycetes bacterium]|nr:hypothetical protein [Planctomycetota bacterium]